MQFNSLEEEFLILGTLRTAFRQMPREVLESHSLQLFQALQQQKRITAEVSDHLEHLRKVLHGIR